MFQSDLVTLDLDNPIPHETANSDGDAADDVQVVTVYSTSEIPIAPALPLEHPSASSISSSSSSQRKKVKMYSSFKFL